MQFKTPKVFVLGETKIQEKGLQEYLDYIGAQKWHDEHVESPEYKVSDAELLSEVYSRTCYKSFGVGLNPNVTKIREGNGQHLRNVIESRHGSVLEHCVINFMLCDVSRVFTHELVRHRVGIAISQESLRYVRLAELSCLDFLPLEEELTKEEEAWFRNKTFQVFTQLEKVQQEMTEKFNLNDEHSFARKKKLTSRMRRLTPLGLLTNIGWSVNLRTLRHIIPLRTHKSAEEEMRYVFAEIGSICAAKYPNIFYDMTWYEDNYESDLGEWRIENNKI